MIESKNSIKLSKKSIKSDKVINKDLTSVKTLFSKELKYSEKIIDIESESKLQNYCEKDIDFVRDLLEIREHSKNLQKNTTAKKTNFDEDLYRFVQDTGKRHHLANKFNTSILKNPAEINSQDKCPCGCNRAKGDKLSYCLNVQKNFFFGQGIILFFYFSTRVLLLMFPIAIVFGIFSFVTNMVSDNTSQTCEKPGALAFLCQLKIEGEIQNKQGSNDLLIVQLVLGVVMCFIWSLGLRLIRRLGMMKGKLIDDMLESSSDYFLFMQKLPIGQYTEASLLAYVYNLWKDIEQENKGELKIKAVEIVYNMAEFRSYITKIRQMAKQLLMCIDEDERKKLKKYFAGESEIPTSVKKLHITPNLSKKYTAMKQQLFKVYKKALKYRQNFLNDKNFRKKITSECALIEFEDDKQLELFLSYYGMNKTTWIQHKITKLKKKVGKPVKTHEFKSREIRMYKAPEPSDIFWTHCQKKTRLRRTIAVWLINLFLTGCSFGILYFLKWLSSQYSEIEALSILTIIGINLFNRFIWRMLLKVVFIEENYTKTINIMSVMNKSYLSQLINIIIIPIILNIGVSDNLHGATGLAGQAHDFQITVFLFMTLFNLVNVPDLFIKFLRFVKPIRRFVIRYLCRVTGELDTYQEMKDALIFLYDPPVVPVAGFYVYITTVIAQAFFFCHLQPVLLFYLIGNLILFFLMNKYIVIQMSKMTDMLDITVFHHISTLGLNIPFMYGVGSIVFLAFEDQSFNFGYYVPSILCFIIGFLSIQSPFSLYAKMLDCILRKCQFIKPVIQTSQPNLDQIETESNLHHQQLEESHKENQKSKFKNMLKKNKKPIEKARRIENYYGGAVGVNQIFNFENKLHEVKGKYHAQYKQFCYQFNTEYFNSLKTQLRSHSSMESLETQKIV